VEAIKEGREMATILIVDDQPHLRELLSLELEDSGHEVEGVGDVQSVKTYFQDSKPDLVLLDLYLNGFEGWDLLRDIKNENPDLPVLIVTAYDNFKRHPALAQADGYVVKSFIGLDGLKQKIDQLLAC
jgi:CheY-like chemotaxis protein